MRIEPIEKFYPTKDSTQKNHGYSDSQEQREGFQRALQEQKRRLYEQAQTRNQETQVESQDKPKRLAKHIDVRM
ncbi:MAG: hypothetical protein ACI4ON_03700 [Clostridia bacterium]